VSLQIKMTDKQNKTYSDEKLATKIMSYLHGYRISTKAMFAVQACHGVSDADLEESLDAFGSKFAETPQRLHSDFEGFSTTEQLDAILERLIDKDYLRKDINPRNSESVVFLTAKGQIEYLRLEREAMKKN